MQTYELTIVLAGKATPAKRKAVQETIQKMVEVFKGKVKSADELGKIELAYPIAKNDSGYFLQFQLELDGKSASDLEQKVRLESGIIRYLLVRKDS